MGVSIFDFMCGLVCFIDACEPFEMIVWFFGFLVFSLVVIAIPLFSLFLTKRRKLFILFFLSILFLMVGGGLYFFLGGSQQLRLYKSSLEIKKIKEEYGTLDNIALKLNEQLKKRPAPKGWYLLGKLYLSQNQLKNALFAFHEGLRMAPGNEELKREYTQTLILEKQQEEPSIDVYVEMSDEIKNQFLPQTVIFVILKSPSLKMPLAAIKRQIKDLPFNVRFGEQDLLIKGKHVSNFKKLKIIVRTSILGNTAKTPGDYEMKKPVEATLIKNKIKYKKVICSL